MLDQRNLAFAITVVVAILLLLFLSSSNTVSDAAQEETKESTYQQPESPSGSTISPDFEEQARQASAEAVQYCSSNPYGTYRTTIYKNGQPIPITIEC